MDPKYVEQMFELGASLVILGMPKGTEFGIDLNVWNVGEKFKGIKMIPPGLHFIYFSAVSKDFQTAPRTGFFHFFEQKEVLVKHYSPKDEDLYNEQNLEQIERIKANIKNLNPDLGPYPYDSWSKWVSLTELIDQSTLLRMQPLSEIISSVPELVNIEKPITPELVLKKCKNDADSSASKANSIAEHDNILKTKATTSNSCKSEPSSSCGASHVLPKPKLPDMAPRPGTEIRFSKIPEKPYREGATPKEITKGNMDSSFSLKYMWDQLERPENILSELQFAFICFLIGQVWDSWEHWRKLLEILCKADECLQEHPGIYTKFLSILHYQIQEVPEDLFVDIVECSNFLAASLTTLFANIKDNAATLPIELVSKSHKFKKHLTSKFLWNLTLEEEGEDAPVIVET